MRIQRDGMFYSTAGGLLDIIGPQGDRVASVDVPPGVQAVAPFWDLLDVGFSFSASDDLLYVPKRGRIAVFQHREHEASGANPDFSPMSEADRLQWQMRQALANMQQATADLRLQQRRAGLDLVETIPRAPELEVIEAATDDQQPPVS